MIGVKRESRQDFKSRVGSISREHEALDDPKMAFRTSSAVAGTKFVNAVLVVEVEEEKVTDHRHEDQGI